MIRIPQLGISLFILLIMACNVENEEIVYKKVSISKSDVLHTEYQNYCRLLKLKEYSPSAVEHSFFGNHKTAELERKKTLGQRLEENTSNLQSQDVFENDEVIENEMLKIVSTEDRASKRYKDALQVLKFIESSRNPSAVFENSKSLPALQTIIEEAQNYHFALINEAHHSAQNRSFTTSLLKPLWNKGYRYLGLEALGYEAPDINTLNYPLLSSGNYIRETSFGNMIREAKRLGYKLITYETNVSGEDGTSRDKTQARIIYDKTLKQDTQGKVLIHAGFGHISEVGDEKYTPMGYWLKELAGQDILTIEQESMIEPIGKTLIEYASYVNKEFSLEKPLIVIDEKGDYIIDPVNASGMDIQVYHPRTFYKYGRPDWLITETNRIFKLPEDFLKFENYLVEIIPEGESPDAVPVDRFIINEEVNGVILPQGRFEMRLFSCEGKLKELYKIEVKI